MFTIEGRAAPGLFVVGWLATILGLGLVIVAVLAGGGLGGSVLFIAGLAALSLGLICGAGSQAIERRARGRTDYTGPSPILTFLVTLPLTILAVVAIGTPLVGLGMDPDGPLAAVVSVALTAAVYVAVIRLLVVGPGALSWSEMGLRRPSGEIIRDVAWGAVLAVPVLFATGLVARLLLEFLPAPPDVLPPAPDLSGVLLNLLTAAVLAPIGEELFFRGFATTAWLRTRGGRGAILLGGLLFAGAHALPLLATAADLAIPFVAFAVRLPVALVLGWLYVRTRSIYGPIALHAAFNGIQVLLLAATGSG